MDITSIIIAIIGFASAAGLSSFFTLKFTKKKAEAEAMAQVQEVYQETIKDLREDKIILKDERDQARNDFRLIAEKVEQNTRDIQAIKDENKQIKDENTLLRNENDHLKSKICKKIDCENRKTK